MRRGGRVCVAVLAIVLSASRLHAAERFAVIVTGASGGAAYAMKYDQWRASLVTTLRQTLGYPDDHLVVIAETEAPNVRRATRENVRRAFGDLRARLTRDDQLLVVLIGHGTTGEGDEAKFNLVGPDLTSGEWADLFKGLPGRLVFVNTTGGSFPFMRQLSAPGRIVLTATDSAAQRFDTVFPEFFVKAFDDPAADADKNGRVSIWEAFAFASGGVSRWFEREGQLPTERPLLDDNGDGVGREAQAPGPDGALARTVYLAPEPAGTGDPEVVRRRAALQQQLDVVRARKASSGNPAQFDADIERLLVEIARLSQSQK